MSYGDDIRELVNEAETGITVLRRVLKRMRWDDQGGYPGRTNGKWNFTSTGLPQTTPEELDALFKLAGIIPDEIVPLGRCEDCAHSLNGRERGYSGPCGGCKRPRMSHFIQLRRGAT